MTYAVGSLILKSIVLMHSCPTRYGIKHRALNLFKNDKPCQNLRVYSSKTDLLEIFSECSCHMVLFKTASKFFTPQTL